MTRSADTVREEMLVLAAQAGDAAAFQDLLRSWLPVMRRHAIRVTGDAEAAEDVAQDAGLALVGALARLRDPARARAWMLGIVTNKSTDWVRRRRRDRRLTRAIQNREPRGLRDDIQSMSGSHEQAARIRAACLHLPVQLRAVVSLYYGEGLPVGSIGEALGAPAGTIKSRLHEARAQLKTILERTSA